MALFHGVGLSVVAPSVTIFYKCFGNFDGVKQSQPEISRFLVRRIKG
jgi:hypothetical protein